ncbi:MAG TPA: TIGR01244 family sulfur transferase [Acidiphilium sp.]|nr:TIGR01244 family sulfur transferase [Acidiphilium sp.]HQU23821.1 TIGR01244 family sulfur transferase [Acidiphilium sp.]
MTALTDQIHVSGWIDPSEIPALSQSGVRTIINNRPDHEQPGQPLAAEAAAIAAEHGITYHHIPVTGASITPADIEAFHQALTGHDAKHGQTTDAKILCHCRSGARSANLWALAQIRHANADPSNIAAIARARNIDLGTAAAWLAQHPQP